MQGRNIIHRDLKPENILLCFDENNKNPDAYIADFGFATECKDFSQEVNIYGTPGYAAPEVLDHAQFTCKSDIFSIGSIIYNIITGVPLFQGRTAKNVLYKNLVCEVKH